MTAPPLTVPHRYARGISFRADAEDLRALEVLRDALQLYIPAPRQSDIIRFALSVVAADATAFIKAVLEEEIGRAEAFAAAVNRSVPNE